LRDLKKYFIIPATPGEVYLALTNPLTIQLWTGEPAVMSTEPGSRFSLWSESITGANISFEKNKQIVQHWDFGEQETPSVVTIKLHEHAKGTSAELRHTNIPDEAFDEIKEGWEQEYFGALIEFYTP
jgi:activator of HSP90 ATPase